MYCNIEGQLYLEGGNSSFPSLCMKYLKLIHPHNIGSRRIYWTTKSCS